MFRVSTLLMAMLMLTACQTVHLSKGRPVNFEKDGDIYVYESWELPEYLSPEPNDATLNYYISKLNNSYWRDARFTVDPQDKTAIGFVSEPMPSKFIEEQLNNTGLLSYIYYDKGIVKYDGVSPTGRFDVEINNKTPFRSASAGKSLVSYLAAHAICKGYIDDVSSPLSDWPLMADTLYGKLRLVDVLDMRAGDQKFVSESTGVQPTKRWYNSFSLTSFAQNELKDTAPSENRTHYYNGLATNVALNYVAYKTGDEWSAFLNEVLVEKVGIDDTLTIRRINTTRTKQDSGATYGFYARRFDYLRLGKAILDDWKTNSCVGQYLKDTMKRRVSKHSGPYPSDGIHSGHRSSKTYAGQFHFDYVGMEDRNIIGLYGYGGQTVLIDLDEERIVVINAVHSNFDWKKLALDVIENGRLP